jgi:hypothetical protein
MPAFYETDDLDTWMFTVFTEHYEHGDEQEQQFNMIQSSGTGLLKEYAEDRLTTAMTWNDDNLLKAVLNTIDYEALRVLLIEWAESSLCENCYALTEGEPCLACEECSGGE